MITEDQTLPLSHSPDFFKRRIKKRSTSLFLLCFARFLLLCFACSFPPVLQYFLRFVSHSSNAFIISDPFVLYHSPSSFYAAVMILIFCLSFFDKHFLSVLCLFLHISCSMFHHAISPICFSLNLTFSSQFINLSFISLLSCLVSSSPNPFFISFQICWLVFLYV